MNISSREAEPEYTAKPDGTAEKALERAVDIRDRHKAKQAARHGDRMAKEASGPVGFQLMPPSGVSQRLSRLALGQFFRLMAALHTHIFLLHLMDFSVEV